MRNLRARIGRLEAPYAVFCPTCCTQVLPVENIEELRDAIMERTLEAMEKSIAEDASRCRELGVPEDHARLIENATAKELQPILPLLAGIRDRLAQQEPAPGRANESRT